MYPRSFGLDKGRSSLVSDYLCCGAKQLLLFSTRLQGCGYTIERLFLLHIVTKKNLAKSIHQNMKIKLLKDGQNVHK